MTDLNKYDLKLDYPCNWKYKLIIRKEIDIQIIMKETLGKRDHSVKQGNISSKGKFTSHQVELLVHNDEDRKELHRIFHSHNNVKMIV